MSARKPKPPGSVLHTLTNLRTPARKQGDAGFADDLSRFTVPKLKLPALTTARKAPSVSSEDKHDAAEQPKANPPTAAWPLTSLQSKSEPTTAQEAPTQSAAPAPDLSLRKEQSRPVEAGCEQKAGSVADVNDQADVGQAAQEQSHEHASGGKPSGESFAAEAATAAKHGRKPADAQAVRKAKPPAAPTRRLLPTGQHAKRQQHKAATGRREASQPTAEAAAAPDCDSKQQSEVDAATEKAPAGRVTGPFQQAAGPEEAATECKQAAAPEGQGAQGRRSSEQQHGGAAQPLSPSARAHATAAAALQEQPAIEATPAVQDAPAVQATPAVGDMPATTQYQSDAEGDDDEAGVFSPEYQPTQERVHVRFSNDSDSESSPPLACQTAIVKRRGRRASAAVVQRYGEWYDGKDGELDAVLMDYNRMQEEEAQREEASARATRAAAARRKSALPVMAADAAAAGEAAANAAGRRAARKRRTTLAPGQGAAAAVAEITRELDGMADKLLPQEEEDGRHKPSVPLRQRLQQSWQGKSYYDRLKEIAEEEGEGEENQKQQVALAAVTSGAAAAAARSTTKAQEVCTSAAGVPASSAVPPPAAATAGAAAVKSADAAPAAVPAQDAAAPGTKVASRSKRIQTPRRAAHRRGKSADAATASAETKTELQKDVGGDNAEQAAPQEAEETTTAALRRELADLQAANSVAAAQISELQAQLKAAQEARRFSQMLEPKLTYPNLVAASQQQQHVVALGAKQQAADAAAAAAQSREVAAVDAAQRATQAEAQVQVLQVKLDAQAAELAAAKAAAAAANKETAAAQKEAAAAAADTAARAKAEGRLNTKLKDAQVALEKKAAALQAEREARRAAEARAAEAESARLTDNRLRRTAERKAKEAEGKLEVQQKKAQEAAAKSDAARDTVKGSAAASSAMLQQLQALELAAAAQVAAATALAEQAATAASGASALRKAYALP